MTSPDTVGVFCRDSSLAAQEPLFGTAASDTDLWIALEVHTAWGPKGLEDSGLPAAVVQCLHRFTAEHRRARVQLIRKPERSTHGPHLYLAHSGERGAQVQSVRIASLDDVVALDLAAFARGDVLPEARVIDEPLYLVCVHGKRDRCCAQHGMPVFCALSALAPEHTFQTTHLGGHRFAATMLVLPHGVSYGRVLASEAQAIVTAHAQGELYDLERLRGRTTYAPAVQAADYLIREQLGERRLSALTFGSVEQLEHVKRVTFRDQTGAPHTADVEREPIGPVVSSCGGPPKPGERFVSLGLSGPAAER